MRIRLLVQIFGKYSDKKLLDLHSFSRACIIVHCGLPSATTLSPATDSWYPLYPIAACHETSVKMMFIHWNNNTKNCI